VLILNLINLLGKSNENPILLKNLKTMISSSNIWKEITFLNCWHMSKFESAAMWKLYSSDDIGISIKSNFKRLEDSFFQCQCSVYIGTVNYIDWDKDEIPQENALAPFSYKRKSFVYDQEIRALVTIISENEDGKYYTDYDGNIQKFIDVEKDGTYIDVDLKTLIEEIYVSPNAKRWFVDLVESVLKKYNMSEKK